MKWNDESVRSHVLPLVFPCCASVQFYPFKSLRLSIVCPNDNALLLKANLFWRFVNRCLMYNRLNVLSITDWTAVNLSYKKCHFISGTMAQEYCKQSIFCIDSQWLLTLNYSIVITQMLFLLFCFDICWYCLSWIELHPPS